MLEGLRVPLAVYQFVEKRVVTLALSSGFCALFGYEDVALAYYDMNHNMYRDTHPDDVARIANAALHFAAEGGNYEVVYRSRIRDSAAYKLIHATGEHIFTADGTRLAYVWYVDEGTCEEGIDGTRLTSALSNALHQESILKATQYDYLTGLPSMTYFFELADAARNAYVQKGVEPAFLYMDLSGMKYFNTKNSFAAGDRLLQAFARLLSNTFHNECCCHLGADHFAAISTEDGLEERLSSFFQACKGINEGDTLPVHVGIYLNRMGFVHASTACDRAKAACDAIRSTYDSVYQYYSLTIRDDTEERQYILSNLDRAFHERWIKAYYQPIVRAVSGRVCDEEALARWEDPQRGLMSPAQFIPRLEEAGLIYKLDLYILERVLEKMRTQRDAGLPMVPHSVNLSRSDFDACDIVEEVRQRVDAAGISHDKITIEITETTLGRNFEFMKEQVWRFQKLGFPVWMDDFGSGYSSLDMLQSIKFDLLKFDMSFMRKFDEGDNARIVLTELMKLAISLRTDTVCEGVETEEQVKFLQEIGCSKLQGYFFCKPISEEALAERYRRGEQIGYENPMESDYYESIGRVNLYDLAVIANEDQNAFQNFFNTLPMAIMEIHNEQVRFVRSNQSYRDFMKRFFGFDLSRVGAVFTATPVGLGAAFMSLVKSCCKSGGRAFFDEQMPDGSVVHSFARRIGTNPVNGKIAMAIAVLSIRDEDEGTTYANIARALASDYYNIYYVDLKTERFIEYTSPVGGEELAVERHGERFFDSVRSDLARIYEPDRELFLSSFTREKISEELDLQGAYSISYRLIDTGVPIYVNMKITRMPNDPEKIILGVSVVD
ncbi:MAG: EAL domain-containing protein, partial [bacterium]